MAVRKKKSRARKATVKPGQKFLLVLAIFFIPVCIFLVPVVYGTGRANNALATGGAAMQGGDFAAGAAHVRFALEQYRLTSGSLDSRITGSARDTLMHAATINSVDALPALAVLHDYGIGVTCEQKESIAGAMFDDKRSRTASGMGEVVYAAALWMQGCAFASAEAKAGFDKRITALRTKGPAAWLDMVAKHGAVFDERYTTTILTKEQLEKELNAGIPEKAREMAAALQFTLKKFTAAVMSLGSGKDAPAPRPAPAKTAKKPAPPAPPPPPAGTPAPPAQPAAQLNRGLPPSEIAVNHITSSLTSSGLSVLMTAFSNNDRLLTIAIRTDSPGKSGALRKETNAILAAAYERAGPEANTGLSVAKLKILIFSKKSKMRYEWDIIMSDYAEYKKGAISDTVFMKRWNVKEY